jgi:DNA polymerase III subunit delta'
MSFAQFTAQQHVVQLLQRSLERGRLAHAYLFLGNDEAELEGVARCLAKTLACEQPHRGAGGVAIDCCDACRPCRKIDQDNHGDTHWVRPEMRSRVIGVDQARDLIREVNLKPAEAVYKVAILVNADRLNASAANAFLKTLEEPPPRSVIILLSTEPQRLLETILSRCLRLSFAGDPMRPLDDAQMAWLRAFTAMAARAKGGLLGRYQLLGTLTADLAERREVIEKDLTSKSPLTRYEDIEPDLAKRLEEELKAAIEAEYRRQRADLLSGLGWWLRDVWLTAQGGAEDLIALPTLGEATRTVGRRLRPEDALANLEAIEATQRHLHTNAQESLALEVGLIKLAL